MVPASHEPGLGLSAGAVDVYHTSGSVLPWSGMGNRCSVNLSYFTDNVFFNVSIKKKFLIPNLVAMTLPAMQSEEDLN